MDTLGQDFDIQRLVNGINPRQCQPLNAQRLHRLEHVRECNGYFCRLLNYKKRGGGAFKGRGVWVSMAHVPVPVPITKYNRAYRYDLQLYRG